MPRLWKVTGGVDKGGIVVRSGKALASEQIDRLSTGSIVAELKLDGERLNFELRSGNGPPTGWVSLKMKDKELLILVDDTGETEAKDTGSLKKTWDTKFLFKGCGANIRALEGGTAGASRDQLFEFLMKQHVSPELRRDFWREIPEHMYDTSLTDETDCITFFQTVGHLSPEPRRKSSAGGVRQKVATLGGLRCIIVEREGLKTPSAVVVLAHGIEVLGDDLYGLAHRLAVDGLRIVLPEAPQASAVAREPEQATGVAAPIDESVNEHEEWRRPLREWCSRSEAGASLQKCVDKSARLLASCAGEAIETSKARLFLGGFSQGAMVALAAAELSSELSGLLLLSPASYCLAKITPGTPVLVSAGSADEICSPSEAENLLKALAAAGAKCEPLLRFDGGHEVTLKVADAAKAFLAKLMHK